MENENHDHQILGLKETRISLREIAKRGKHNMPSVLPGLKPGTVGGLVAQGGTGKTFLLQQITVTMALCTPDLQKLKLDLVGLPHSKGKVVYLALDDPREEFEDRLYDIISPIRKHKNSDALLSQLEENLEFASLQGNVLNILDEAFYQHIRQKCDGAMLLIVDTLRKVHQSEENSNTEMSRVMAQLSKLPTDCKRGSTGWPLAVLYAHHPSQASQFDGSPIKGAAATRGASSIVADGRCTMIMSISKKDPRGKLIPQESADSTRYVSLIFPKVNYGGKPAEAMYERCAKTGILKPCEVDGRFDRRQDVQVAEQRLGDASAQIMLPAKQTVKRHQND